MSEFLFEIITPSKQFFKGQAEQFICQTTDGEMGILKGHGTMVATLTIGEIRIKTGGEWKNAYISGGFMEVRNDEVLVFSNCCEWPEEIDEAKAEESRRKAAELMLHEQNVREHRHNEITLARAMARLKVKKEYRNVR